MVITGIAVKLDSRSALSPLASCSYHFLEMLTSQFFLIHNLYISLAKYMYSCNGKNICNPKRTLITHSNDTCSHGNEQKANSLTSCRHRNQNAMLSLMHLKV